MDSFLKNKEQLIVYLCLGYALQVNQDEKVTMAKELVERLDFLAQQFSKQTSQSTNEQIMIVTSGRGKIEIESKHMKDYLIQQCSIDEKYIYNEKYSMNTVENFLFTFYHLWNSFDNNLRSQESKIKIELRVVTSDYHVKRVQYIADAATRVILKVFQNCEFLPLQFLGAKTSTEKTEEPAILWDKATEKINRILSFNFEIKKFMEEREFTEEDKRNFLIFKDKILS